MLVAVHLYIPASLAWKTLMTVKVWELSMEYFNPLVTMTPLNVHTISGVGCPVTSQGKETVVGLITAWLLNVVTILGISTGSKVFHSVVTHTNHQQ